MITSIRATIRAFARPEHRLSCSPILWRQLFDELHRRGEERRESGAFLLGRVVKGRRRIEKIVPYDDLDPHSLDTGIIRFDGAKFGDLFDLCRSTGLVVVADVHTHGGAPWQSETDRVNPAIQQAGHIALIVPRFARHLVMPDALGIYEYQGRHRWNDHSGDGARRFLLLSHI